jgi:hypothetical protein
MRALYKKLRTGVAKLKVDNVKDLGYRTGMMGPLMGRTKKIEKNNNENKVEHHKSNLASTVEVQVTHG